MSKTKIKRSSIVQEEYKTLSPKKNILDKKRLNPPFCLYTLLLPFISYLIFIIFGICGQTCRNNDLVIDIIYVIYGFLIYLNIVLFLKGHNQYMLNGIAVFCNIAMCLFFAISTHSAIGFFILLMGGFIGALLYIIIWFIMLQRWQRYLKDLQ